jgi:hypothetical protein
VESGQSGISAQEYLMKKLIVSVLTVGALAAAGAASAQDIFGGLGNVLPQILGNIGLGNVYPEVPGSIYNGGYGQPAPGSVVRDANGRPVVIAATGVAAMPGGTVVDSADGGQVTLDASGTYIDRYGRRIQVDMTGRHTPISGVGVAGVAQSRLFDRDRDGVPDSYDRYPNDPRYR